MTFKSISTVDLLDEIERRIHGNDGTPPQQAAVRTLVPLGYTYHGGELWKPPIEEGDPTPRSHRNLLIIKDQKIVDLEATVAELKAERDDLDARLHRANHMLAAINKTLKEAN